MTISVCIEGYGGNAEIRIRTREFRHIFRFPATNFGKTITFSLLQLDGGRNAAGAYRFPVLEIPTDPENARQIFEYLAKGDFDEEVIVEHFRALLDAPGYSCSEYFVPPCPICGAEGGHEEFDNIKYPCKHFLTVWDANKADYSTEWKIARATAMSGADRLVTTYPHDRLEREWYFRY